MARCRARRFRPSGRARTARHRAVPVESSEHQYGRKHARLATQPDDEPARLVGSTDRDRCRSVGLRFGSSSHLDCCAHLDGSGLHPECVAVRPHALLHRTFLSGHDCAGVFACGRHRLRRIFGLAVVGSPHSRGKQNHLVGPRPQITTPHDGSRGRIQRLAARPATSSRAGYRPKSWRHML
jgi:hypothetical protein